MIRLPLGEAGPKGLKGQIDSKNRYFSAYKFPVPRLPWAFHFACPLARGQVFFVSYGLFKLVCVHSHILVPPLRHTFPKSQIRSPKSVISLIPIQKAPANRGAAITNHESRTTKNDLPIHSVSPVPRYLSRLSAVSFQVTMISPPAMMTMAARRNQMKRTIKPMREP